MSETNNNPGVVLATRLVEEIVRLTDAVRMLNESVSDLSALVDEISIKMSKYDGMLKELVDVARENDGEITPLDVVNAYSIASDRVELELESEEDDDPPDDQQIFPDFGKKS